MTMADPNEPNGPPVEDGVEIEAEAMEVEPPRRAASAQFVVEAGVGSEAALREAMDPANQSLAEALRLSYRVLQFVILGLVALFIVSGFQRVDERQSGVMLRFGKIVTVGDQQALEPGLRRNILPYPAGEFIIFDVEGRSVDVGNTYWPRIPAGATLQQAIDRANVNSVLEPGKVGTVVTVDGDLGHLKLTADYQIVDPVRFVERMREADVDRIVRMALERAVVLSTAAITLQELVDQPEVAADRIRLNAQDVLDTVDCGIQLTDVKLPDAKPPFAIVKVYGELQNAREEARRDIENARQAAEATLIDAAGANYLELAGLVAAYEDAEDRGDRQRADELMNAINGFLEGTRTSGELAEIIRQAQAYESEIERTLGNEARRFAMILPSYREQPDLVIKRRWLESVGTVLSREDVEIIRVFPGMGSIGVKISGQEEIAKIRRKLMLQRKQIEAELKAAGSYEKYLQRSADWEPGTSNPLLQEQEGRIRARGSRN